MLGPDGSAQPLLVSAPPGAEAPAGTRCSAPHPPSGSRRCKVTGKSTGWKGRTQPRSRSFPGSPSLQHASLPAGGGDGPEAGCAQALACCCRASLGAQHPVVLQGPNACTPNTAGKGLSPHLHRWMLQGCRDSGTAGCAEQLNHTSPCQDVLERSGDDHPWDRAVGHTSPVLQHQPRVAAPSWAWRGPPVLPAASAPLLASSWATGEGG